MTSNFTTHTAFVLCLLSLAAPAYAGQTKDFNVTVDSVNRTASGAIGTARHDPSTAQDINCTMEVIPGTDPMNGHMATVIMSCNATSTNGTYGYCFGVTTGPTRLPLGTITDDSYIKFTWDSSGQCTSLEVRNYSYNRPRQ